MPRRPARTARSSSRSSKKRIERASDTEPEVGWLAVGEVVGFGVDTVQGERVGTIAATFATGTNDVWVVQAAEREHLIPVVAEIVRAIDRAGRRVVIDPSPGLLD